MEQTLPTNTPDTAEAADGKNGPKVTLEILIARMMQTRRDINAYDRGEITKTELEALGVKLF